MSRLFAAAAVAATLALAPSSISALPAAAGADHHDPRPPDTYVAAWDSYGSQAFTAAALTPAEGHTIFAYAAIAEYDAVMAVSHRYQPFAIIEHAPAGTSAEAAVVAAAHRVFAHYLPAQVPGILDPAFRASLDTIPDGAAKTDGVALGERVAAGLIAVRLDDGFRAPATYTPPDPPIPGVWLPTAPTPPAGTYLGQMRPFALRSADQFRPDGPPGLSSRRWARDYGEVAEIGSSTSSTRTDDQTLAAQFWAQPPVQQARATFRRFVSDHALNIVDAARFMAMVSVTYADAQIACYEAKYHFAFWRPITAVRAGDTDLNPATVGDPAWSPLLPATPNHPEYPSAHSCITPAGGLVAERFLGTRHIDLTVPSQVAGVPDRHYATTGELTTEVTNARIWGGIHFRSAVQDGVTMSRQVAHAVLSHHFGRLHR